MNMLEAMRDTVALMEIGLGRLEAHSDAPEIERIECLDASVRPEHIRDMLKTMLGGDNPQHPGEPFGEGKMGRWLGWAQAAVVAMGLGTLDEMKAINKRWAGPA